MPRGDWRLARDRNSFRHTSRDKSGHRDRRARPVPRTSRAVLPAICPAVPSSYRFLFFYYRTALLQSYNSLEAPMTKQLAAEQLAVSDWVKNLAAFPECDFTLGNVQDYIVRHAVRPETLDKYLFFSKGSYTRNLI